MVDDSGTESGEEVNQKILIQVQGALANLESALPALDPLRRSSVVELLTKLQASLRLSTEKKPTPPPRKCWNKKTTRQDRHTVGVSSEELQDARRWLEENGYTGITPTTPVTNHPVSACSTPRSYDVFTSKTFRPVKFVPPPPKRTHYTEDYIPEPSKQSLQNNSFACPPLQHGVIVENLDKRRKLSTATSNRDSSDSSSENLSDDNRSVSSAQRLLQFASNDHGRKYRHGKRVKLKRGVGPHTDDDGRSSGDERRVRPKVSSGSVPQFEPKTASDKKYLALMRQAKEDEATAALAYNPLHGKLQGNWGNRFGRIKTTFERGAAAAAAFADKPKRNVAKTWNDICKCPSNDSIAYRSKKATSFKPVWSGENGFSHATKSAFKPVGQKFTVPSECAPRTIKLAPPKPTHLPLYNSSVTTAHRPFIYPSPEKSEDLNNNNPQQWNMLPSPCSVSDFTSRSTSPLTDLDVPLQPTVTSRVMGSPQTASIVKSKAGHRSLYPSPSMSSVHTASLTTSLPVPVIQAPRPPPRSPRLVPQQRSPTSSPVCMPSVLQKSESWHQMIMGQSKAAARPAATVPNRPVAPYEGYLPKDQIVWKQNIVRQHLRPTAASATGSVKCVSPKLVKLNDDIDKVDDTFESLFKESTKVK